MLVQLGELRQAEVEVAAILEERADDLDALRLYANNVEGTWLRA